MPALQAAAVLTFSPDWNQQRLEVKMQPAELETVKQLVLPWTTDTPEVEQYARMITAGQLSGLEATLQLDQIDQWQKAIEVRGTLAGVCDDIEATGPPDPRSERHAWRWCRASCSAQRGQSSQRQQRGSRRPHRPGFHRTETVAATTPMAGRSWRRSWRFTKRQLAPRDRAKLDALRELTGNAPRQRRAGRYVRHICRSAPKSTRSVRKLRSSSCPGRSDHGCEGTIRRQRARRARAGRHRGKQRVQPVQRPDHACRVQAPDQQLRRRSGAGRAVRLGNKAIRATRCCQGSARARRDAASCRRAPSPARWQIRPSGPATISVTPKAVRLTSSGAPGRAAPGRGERSRRSQLPDRARREGRGTGYRSAGKRERVGSARRQTALGRAGQRPGRREAARVGVGARRDRVTKRLVSRPSRLARRRCAGRWTTASRPGAS